MKNPELASAVEQAIAFLEKRPAQKTGGELVFNAINASVKLNNGIADNHDLKVDMPLLSVRGAGRVDLADSRIDYRLRVGLRKRNRDDADHDERRDKAIEIPIKISGALDNPKYSVDLERVLREQAEQKLKRELQKKKKQLRDKVDEKKEQAKNEIRKKLDDILKGTLKLPF